MDKPGNISRAASYAVAGYFFGYLTARSTPGEMMSFEQMLITIAAAAFIGLLFWIGGVSRQRQSNNWNKTRTRGKWPFVLLYYLLARSFVLLVILFLPIMIQLGSTTPLLIALACAAIILCPLFTFIGHQDWLKNEREYLADPIIKAARARLTQSQQQVIGGGA